MEQKGNRNPASGEEIKKPEAVRQTKESDSDRRTGDHGIPGGRESNRKYGCPGGSALPAGRNRRLCCADRDRWVCGEEEMEEALKDAEIIVADPLYKPICPKNCDIL